MRDAFTAPRIRAYLMPSHMAATMTDIARVLIQPTHEVANGLALLADAGWLEVRHGSPLRYALTEMGRLGAPDGLPGLYKAEPTPLGDAFEHGEAAVREAAGLVEPTPARTHDANAVHGWLVGTAHATGAGIVLPLIQPIVVKPDAIHGYSITACCPHGCHHRLAMERTWEETVAAALDRLETFGVGLCYLLVGGAWDTDERTGWESEREALHQHFRGATH